MDIVQKIVMPDGEEYFAMFSSRGEKLAPGFSTPEGAMMALRFFDRAEQIGAARAAQEFRLPCQSYGADSDFYSTAVEIEPGSLTLFGCGWVDRWDTETVSKARAQEVTGDLEFPITAW